MIYTILSAKYANADNLSAIITTKEDADVLVSQHDTPNLWTQFQNWITGGGVPAAYVNNSPGTEDAQEKVAAKNLLANSKDRESKQIRALIATTVNSLNTLRGWTVSFKAAVAGAATLGALKTAVAALPDLPDLQLSNIKQTMANIIDAGSAD